MNQDFIRIVLVATSHPGNIGSAARAMKTMGLKHLWLVNPKTFPDRWANELAAGADDVLENARVTATLSEALVGCTAVFGTSARAREMSLPGFTPFEAAERIVQSEENAQTAIVFGREHAGLTNDELLQCHAHILIPSDPAFSSLNLAQAVQIMAYELRMRSMSPKAEVSMRSLPLASNEALELFYSHLEKVLIEIEFLKPSNPKKLLQRLRRLFNRVHLEEREVQILRGILTHIERACRDVP